MKITFRLVLFLMLISIIQTGYGVEMNRSPRIAIVISKASFTHRWGVTQMAAHGWAGVSNLAGLPYDCLFLSELPQQDLSRYQALIFGQCTYVENELYPHLVSQIEQYLAGGGNLIIDGPMALSDAETQDLDHSQLDQLLGISYVGFRGNSDYRIKIADEHHYITRIFEPRQFITQHLVNGLNIIDFQDAGQTLLVCSNERQSFPFLSCRDDGKNRVVLVNDFSTWSGVPSFFRNVQPQVFYANQIFSILVRALHWTVYGDLPVPFPVAQVTNADLAAIIRLDADASGNLDAQIKTINYLVDLARETGVVPVYAWVSSQATRAGWQDLAPLGKKIEEVGGEIGTHSKFHRINREMNEQRWKEELDDAIREIEFNMADYDYPIGKVEFFINPGNTIYMDDYEQLARRFSFYMTHGFEQDMPIGFGNLTWYTGDHKNFVVLENTPSPDYQWFYDPTWSYTTQQITAYQEAIFDHLFHNVGRGVIYNQMWHDYSITSQPQYGKDRIMNKNNLAMYDAIKAKFAVHDIYCPTPVDLTQKIRVMAQWDYRWKSEGDKINMTLDFTPARLDTLPHFTGGMGLRIENSTKFIEKVLINGKEHYAFREQLIILPPLQKGVNTVEVTLRPEKCRVPHLTFISKPLMSINKSGENLEIYTVTRSKSRFAFSAPPGYILLNADAQEWNRNGDQTYRGFVTSDRKITLKKMKNSGIAFPYCTVRFIDVKEEGSQVLLKLEPAGSGSGELQFTAVKVPGSATFGSKELTMERNANRYVLQIPEFSQTTELSIKF